MPKRQLLNWRSEYIYFPFCLILNFKKVFSPPFLTFNFVSFCFRAGINHFYVVHENGDLCACSKGCPTKALAKKRLECPEQIEEELAGLRKDFLLNDKCKMLVLVSIDTNEMIRLVSMYP